MNSRRFYCNFPNSRHLDIAAVLNMLKLHCDFGAVFFTKKIALKIAVNIARVNAPLEMVELISRFIGESLSELLGNYDS